MLGYGEVRRLGPVIVFAETPVDHAFQCTWALDVVAPTC